MKLFRLSCALLLVAPACFSAPADEPAKPEEPKLEEPKLEEPDEVVLPDDHEEKDDELSLVGASPEDKQVLQAPAGEWTYVSFPDTRCRDGSPAGISVRRNPRSDKLIIYMEGGGLCADAQTCLDGNPANNDGMRESYVAGLRGMFDFANPANPVADWNVVYVPYCSGDMHAGDRRDVEIEGVGVQQFQGRNNLHRFLKPVAKLVRTPSHVVLTGASAGGFGAMMSFKPVQDAFASVEVQLIDDSGPFLNSNSIPSCLQKAWSTTLGWDHTFRDDCSQFCTRPSKDCCADDGDYMQDYAVSLAQAYAGNEFGLIETASDGVVTYYFGTGLADCSGTLWSSAIPTQRFTNSLFSFRNMAGANFSTYVPPSTQHTYIQTDSFYSTDVAGTSLVAWFAALANGEHPGHVGP